MRAPLKTTLASWAPSINVNIIIIMDFLENGELFSWSRCMNLNFHGVNSKFHAVFTVFFFLFIFLFFVIFRLFTNTSNSSSNYTT